VELLSTSSLLEASWCFLLLVLLLLSLLCCSSNPSIVLHCFVSADLLFVLSIPFMSCQDLYACPYHHGKHLEEHCSHVTTPMVLLPLGSDRQANGEWQHLQAPTSTSPCLTEWVPAPLPCLDVDYKIISQSFSTRSSYLIC